MTTLHLNGDDARLLYLAVQYHFDRPGADLDPATGRPARPGMAELARSLGDAFVAPETSLALTPFQAQRLASAILGAVNELKVYPMLAAGGRRSVAVRFEAALRHLFPDVPDDPEEALAIARALVRLKRRLDIEAANGRAGPWRKARRGRWRFWQR